MSQLFVCIHYVILCIVRRWRVVTASCFFFQAEDGIRDLVRSRGLGDVYKRQLASGARRGEADVGAPSYGWRPPRADRASPPSPSPVSYTHLTLPTSDLV